MAKKYIIIMTMCASLKEARNISRSLLSRRLVACTNIVSGIESRFWWKGSLKGASEHLVIMKTVGSNYKKVEAAIERLHGYEVPEIISLPISAGNRDFLDWISASIV